MQVLPISYVSNIGALTNQIDFWRSIAAVIHAFLKNTGTGTL